MQPIASEVIDLMDRLQRDENRRNMLASSWTLYEAAVEDGVIERGQIDWLARSMQELHEERLIAYRFRNGGTAVRSVWDSAEIQQMHDWRVTAEGRRDASLFRAEGGRTLVEGSDPQADADTPSDKPVDVFISHASEDKKDVARPLFDALTRLGWAVWLDELELKIGDSLSRQIDAALARSRFGIVILSPAFFAKEWPQRELGGLAARELATGAKVILPVWHNVDHKYIAQRSLLLADRLGVLTSIGIDKVAREVAAVLSEDAPGQPLKAAAGNDDEHDIPADDQAVSLFQIPVTDVAQEELIQDKPRWWEYRLYVGALMQGRIELEGKWHDHELRLPRGPRRIPSESPSEFLSRETAELSRFMETLDRVFDPEVLEQGFGPPGQAGDSRRIVHIARGVIQVYESMMDWAAELRSNSIASDYHEILELTARMADGPVRQTRDFIQRSADQIARIPLLIEEARCEGATTESPMEVELVLHVELTPKIRSSFRLRSLDTDEARFSGLSCGPCLIRVAFPAAIPLLKPPPNVLSSDGAWLCRAVGVQDGT